MKKSKYKKPKIYEQNTKKSVQLSLRRARHKDIDDLVEICKKNFKRIIIWQLPQYFLRKRWKYILSSDAAETWICTANDKVVGLVTLIFNTFEHKQKVRHLNSGFLKKICFYLMCPRLSFLTIIKKINIITSGDKIRTVIQNKATPSKCAWIEPLAVLPCMYRKGIATKLIKQCEKRTIQLKISGIKLLVRPNNTAATHLYEKLGFICSGHNKYTDTYTLILKEETTDEIQEN